MHVGVWVQEHVWAQQWVLARRHNEAIVLTA